MSFTVYIDESGDVGVSRVRNGENPGASPYFVVGAVVANSAAAIRSRQVLEISKKEIGKSAWKHATDLPHAEKVFLARQFGNLPVRYFAVISNKSTLGDYKDEIRSDPQKFYDKCVLYLMEIVCAYMIKAGATENDMSFVFERRNHDYDMMIRYLERAKNNPMYPQSKSLVIMNPFAITTRAKGEEDMLEISDFVSHAVYQCSNKTPSNYFIPEPRYFLELSSRFAGDEHGCLLNVGLKPIHTLGQLELDKEIEVMFKTAKVIPPPRAR